MLVVVGEYYVYTLAIHQSYNHLSTLCSSFITGVLIHGFYSDLTELTEEIQAYLLQLGISASELSVPATAM